MIVNQPKDMQLGVNLIGELESSRYSNFTIMVAYAKLSGVNRLMPYIKKFHENGGTMRIVVGIDQQNTSYDALNTLIENFDEIYIYHSDSFSQTFHVKCYWLQGENECWYAIGSNNLTAGGLFGNYEMSVVSFCSGKVAEKENINLEKIFKYYSNSLSPCSKRLDNELLEELLNNNYVIKENEQRNNNKKVNGLKDRNKKIFGCDVFPVPSIGGASNKDKKRNSKDNNNQTKIIAPSELKNSVGDYLIRLIPKAGNRSKQVHFTIELLSKYFRLNKGDTIYMQQMLSDGSFGELEQRQIVLSPANRNVKIELVGASVLDTMYPENPETRPVLLIKRISDNIFVYMLLLYGDEGYASINNRLKGKSHGNALPYEIIDEETMTSLWLECPIA